MKGRRKTNTGRNGLGLSIAKAIVEENGGSIWVEGANSAGARFVITLPRSEHLMQSARRRRVRYYPSAPVTGTERGERTWKKSFPAKLP